MMNGVETNELTLTGHPAWNIVDINPKYAYLRFDTEVHLCFDDTLMQSFEYKVEMKSHLFETKNLYPSRLDGACMVVTIPHYASSNNINDTVSAIFTVTSMNGYNMGSIRFTFLPDVEFTAIQPSVISELGGEVTIFADREIILPTILCRFNEIIVPSTEVVNNMIKCQVPVLPIGNVKVWLSSEGSIDWFAIEDLLLKIEPQEITVSPSFGGLVGNTAVSIIGVPIDDANGMVLCKFGQLEVPAVVESAKSIKCWSGP